MLPIKEKEAFIKNNRIYPSIDIEEYYDEYDDDVPEKRNEADFNWRLMKRSESGPDYGARLMKRTKSSQGALFEGFNNF